jgi:hypothetical protein
MSAVFNGMDESPGMYTGTAFPRAWSDIGVTRLRRRLVAQVSVTTLNRAALVALTPSGLGLRLALLSAKSLWIDETFSIGMVSQSWGSFLRTLGNAQPNSVGRRR